MLMEAKKEMSFYTSYAIEFAGDLPHAGESDTGVLYIRHPPSQLFADSVIRSFGEATHLFATLNLLPCDTS